MMKLDRPLCVFDLEATGTDVMQDRIVDVCIARYEADGTQSVFSSLVNPGVPIPPEATAIHHITDAMVAAEPTIKDLAPKLLEILDGADLAGFNAGRYDIPLLHNELKRANFEWVLTGKRIVDAFTIFQRKERRDLTAAYKFYCGKDHSGAHRAEADVIATAEILFAQVERYADLPKDVAGLDAFCNAVDPSRVDADGKFVWKSGEAAFGFGNKHKGKTLREVVAMDRGYISWMVDKGNFSADVVRICREALEGTFPVKKA
jgi:DNA polymerase-3 subunit epsilon